MGGDVLACLEALEKVSDLNGGPRIAADAHMKAALRKQPCSSGSLARRRNLLVRRRNRSALTA